MSGEERKVFEQARRAYKAAHRGAGSGMTGGQNEWYTRCSCGQLFVANHPTRASVAQFRHAVKARKAPCDA